MQGPLTADIFRFSLTSCWERFRKWPRDAGSTSCSPWEWPPFLLWSALPLSDACSGITISGTDLFSSIHAPCTLRHSCFPFIPLLLYVSFSWGELPFHFPEKKHCLIWGSWSNPTGSESPQMDVSSPSLVKQLSLVSKAFGSWRSDGATQAQKLRPSSDSNSGDFPAEEMVLELEMLPET